MGFIAMININCDNPFKELIKICLALYMSNHIWHITILEILILLYCAECLDGKCFEYNIYYVEDVIISFMGFIALLRMNSYDNFRKELRYVLHYICQKI